MVELDALVAARENLWRAQTRFNYFPRLTVRVNDFTFHMKHDDQDRPAPFIHCRISDELLSRLLRREVHWNNLELACLISFNRRPNVYEHDFHMLMSFFHLPYGTP